MNTTHTSILFGFLLITSVVFSTANAHEKSRQKFIKARQVADAKNPTADVDRDSAGKKRATCQLTVRLVDRNTKDSLPGLVRISVAGEKKPLLLKELIKREQNWHAMPANATVSVPQAKLKIEAFQGLETELATNDLNLAGKKEALIKVTLHRFYDASAKGLRSGNTHLHLMKLTHAEAHRYLREVPRADNLDLVFLSHLRRIPDERHYITNQIVENSLAGGELARLSQDGVLIRPGEEHRHNFGRGGEGFGHVMLLDIVKLIRPVSIGPGIMAEGTDGIPLQRGIREARSDGASVVWCHNTFGFEDIPNWMAGVLDAQNIFDGGNHGSYKDTFYRYLNLGMSVPFSTGTDWFMYDFNRVYVPLEGKLTGKSWLGQLADGRTFITNGTFLELTADENKIGDTIQLAKAKKIKIQARGIGRADFKNIEIIQNGEVVGSADTKSQDGHFVAELNASLSIDKPGWVALRIPSKAGTNQFGKRLFAHTSPIYIELAGKRIFQPEIAEQMIVEIEKNVEVIKAKAKFADIKEREAVLKVHRQGIAALRKRIEENQ